MDYIGSKEKLNSWIFSHIDKQIKPGSIFLDACSGSGSVSRAAAIKGYSVIANDNMVFSSHLIMGSIGVDPFLEEAQHHIDIINSLPPDEVFTRRRQAIFY